MRPKADKIFRVNLDDDTNRLASIAHVGRTGDLAIIYNIWVNPDLRGAGFGTAVLREVCNWADQEMVELELMIDPSEDSPLGLEGLFDWYRRHDFEMSEKGLMHRDPKA